MSFDDFLNELNRKIDITELVSPYTRLRKNGRLSIGLCPFHHEKTPSFTVYSDTQSFYCYGCGLGGDIITFIRLAENLDYLDALKYLADKTGVELPNIKLDGKASKLKKEILEINRVSAKFFHAMLHTAYADNARKYLINRGLSEATIKHFGLGFAPKSGTLLVDYLKKKGYSDDAIEKSNVAYKKNGVLTDRFFNRVMFPIIDVRGNVIAFGARAMGNAMPKYLNTSDTLVFKKSENLFALNFAKNSKKTGFILAEGYMDVIALHKIGFTETVASLGTSLTTGQARLIARYAKEVVIAYDADDAGQKATNRAIPILRDAGLSVRILKLPSGKDPDEFIHNNKDADIKIKNFLKNTLGDIDFRINKLKNSYNILSTSGRIEFINKVCELFSTIENEVERDIYISKLAREEKIDKNVLKDQIQKTIKKNNKTIYKKKPVNTITGHLIESDRALTDTEKRISSMEENIFAYIMKNPDVAEKSIMKMYNDYEEFVVNKQLFDFILKKIKENKEFSLLTFNEGFPPEKIGIISKIINEKSNNIMTKEQLYKYIDDLCCEYMGRKIALRENVTPADITAFIDAKRKQKS